MAIGDRNEVRRKRPIPTAVQRALEHGTTPTTEPMLVLGSVPNEVSQESSVPINVGTQLDRIEMRQRDARDDNDQAMIQIAAVLGDHSKVLGDHTKLLGELKLSQESNGTELKSMVKLAEKADAREQKAADRADAIADKRSSARQQIVLAVIAAIVTLGGAYFVGRQNGAVTLAPPAPALPSPVPSSGHAL